MTENEMAGWHHLLNGYEFEQTLGDMKGDSEGNLVCCRLQSRKESDMTEHAYKFPYSSCLSTLQNFSCSLF